MSLKYYLKHYKNDSAFPKNRLEIREHHCICRSCKSLSITYIECGEKWFCSKKDERIYAAEELGKTKKRIVRRHFCLYYRRDYLKPKMEQESLKHSNLLKALRTAFDRKYPISRVFDTALARVEINKITKILDRIKNMIDEVDGNAVELENVVEILECEDDLEREFIEETIDQAVKEGTLYSPRMGYISFAINFAEKKKF